MGLPRASLWQHHDFLKMWSGEMVSLLGDQFTSLAFPLTAVLILQASPSQMGILQALGTLPFLLLGLIAGVWADRYRRRRLMILSDVSRALLLLCVPVAFVSGNMSIYLLYFVTFGTGMFTVVFDVTYQAYLPSLVEREQLIDANGRLQASASAASVVGPSLAGGLISFVAAPFAILFDSFSFIWSVVSLVGFGVRRHRAPGSREGPSWRRSTRGSASCYATACCARLRRAQRPPISSPT
jgi:MFS family permease